MPYSKQGYFKKKTRKRHYKAGYGENASFRSAVKRVIRESSDRKFHDTATNSTTPVTGTSEIIHLTDIDEGDTNLTRSSETIYIDSIQIVGTVSSDPDITEDDEIRIMLVRANENLEGALPAMTDILMSDSVRSLSQIDNRGDFTVWLNERVLIRQCDLGIIGKKQVNYWKKLKKALKCHYDGTGGGIADAEKGHWFLILMTQQAAGSQPRFILNTRVAFKEMA